MNKKGIHIIWDLTKKTIPFPSKLNLHTAGTCTKLYQSLYIMGKGTNRIGKRKRTINIQHFDSWRLKYTARFASNSMFESCTWENITTVLRSIILELVGGILPLDNVVTPRRVHWRKLVIIRFQRQSKIRQLGCCLHDSVVKDFQISLITEWYHSFLPFIPVKVTSIESNTKKTKKDSPFMGVQIPVDANLARSISRNLLR